MYITAAPKQHLWQAAAAFPWQQQAPRLVFSDCVQGDIGKGLSVTLGAVTVVQGLILHGAISSCEEGLPDLLGSDATVGAAALLPLLHVSHSVNRGLQAVGLYPVPSLWAALQGLLLHRQLSITASDFSIKFHFRVFGGFSPAYSLLK